MKKPFFLLIVASLLLSNTVLAQDYRLEQNVVVIERAVTFKPGTAQLLPESDAAFLIIKKYLEDKAYISLLRVEAHVGKTPDTNAAKSLSTRRASAICQRMIQLGVDCGRLLPVGFGDTKPVTNGQAAAANILNERIVFVNASLKGKAIGGLPVEGGGKIVENPCY